MPGPPPNPNARRRNARPDWRRLPVSGRQGDPPDFPLPRPSKGVLSIWADLWTTPQAVAWEQLGWNRVVARYAKLLLGAEKSNATAALLGEVRQMEDRLGLSPMAMKRLQWETYDDVAADQEQDAGVTNLDDYRDRTG